MTLRKSKQVHDLCVEQFERDIVPKLAELSENARLECPTGFSDRILKDDDFWSADLKSVADYVYWKWSPAYYAALARKEAHLAPSERQDKIQAAADALQKFIKILNDTDNTDRERILTLLANSVYQSDGEWYDIHLDEFETRLKSAVKTTRTLGDEKIEGRGRGRTNPGLSYLIQELDLFWRHQSSDRKPITAYFEDDEDQTHADIRQKPLTIQTPLNDSSFFCCEVAKIIDPRISDNQVRTAMKSADFPDLWKKYRILRSFIGGRDST